MSTPPVLYRIGQAVDGEQSPDFESVWAEACEQGEPRIGGIFGVHQAQIDVAGIEPHYFTAKCRRYPDPVRNLRECIRVAKQIRAVLVIES